MSKKISLIAPVSDSPVEKETTVLRVAAYARVSTDEDEQMNSLAAQRAYFDSFFANHPDWINAGIYYDEGITGTSMKRRDGFNRMIADALDGKIDRIFVKSISRFARNTVDKLQTLRKLKVAGVTVFFEKENMDSDDMKSEFILTIMSSLAQEESTSISENVKWSLRKGYAQGHVSIPYSSVLGYKAKPGKKFEMLIDKKQAVTVRLIYRLFLEGQSLYAIQHYLTENNYQPPHGDTWYDGTVRSILRNEKYCGDAILQKTFTVDMFQKKKKKNEGELPKYYIENDHPAIIRKDTWNEAQSRLTTLSKGHNSRMYPFSSKLICGECGRFFSRRGRPIKPKEETIIPLWRCSCTCGGHSCGNIKIHESQLRHITRNAFTQLFKRNADVSNTLFDLISKSIRPKNRHPAIKKNLRLSVTLLTPDVEDLFIRVMINHISVFKNKHIIFHFIDGTTYECTVAKWGMKKERALLGIPLPDEK